MLIKEPTTNGSNSRIWIKIWKARVHERHKMMFWRTTANVLPCSANLGRLFHIPNPSCPLCGSLEETPVHLFTACPLAQILWRQSPYGIISSIWNFTSSKEMINHFLDPGRIAEIMGFNCKLLTLYAAILYTIMWFHRNSILHDQAIPNPSQAIKLVLQEFMEFSNKFKEENTVAPSPEADSSGVGLDTWLPPSLSRAQI